MSTPTWCSDEFYQLMTLSPPRAKCGGGRGHRACWEKPFFISPGESVPLGCPRSAFPVVFASVPAGHCTEMLQAQGVLWLDCTLNQQAAPKLAPNAFYGRTSLEAENPGNLVARMQSEGVMLTTHLHLPEHLSALLFQLSIQKTLTPVICLLKKCLLDVLCVRSRKSAVTQ